MADSSGPWTEPAVGAERHTLARWIALLLPVARRAWAFGAVALVGSWLGFYLITPWPAFALDAFRATVLLHAVTGAVLILYLFSLLVRRQLPGGSLLDVPVVAALGAYFLATAASENWRVSLENSLHLLMAASVFFVLADARLLRRWQVEAGLMLAVLAGALRALWLVGGDYLDWLQLSRAVHGGLSWGDLLPPTVPSVSGVSDHPNMLGMALAMTLPFFLVVILRRGVLVVRAFGLVGFGVVSLALLLTLSRGAWLGAATGSVVTLGVSALLLPGGREALGRLTTALSGRRRWWWFAGGSAGMAVAVVVAAFVITSWDARPEWLFRGPASSRWDVLATGAEVVRDYPLLGTGPDVFGLLYPAYSGRSPQFHYHTHNGFLQTAVDAGVPGVLGMMLLGGAFVWLLLRAVPRASPVTRLSLIASGGGLAGFATHSLFDAPNESKAVLVVLAAVGAVAVLSRREAEEPAEPEEGRATLGLRVARLFHLGIRAVIPLAMAGLLITWGRLDIGHYYYSNSLSNADAQHWPRALEQARRSVELDPQFAIYRLHLGTIQAQTYLVTLDPALLYDAIGQLERALELEPRSAVGHANLALLLAQATLWQEARTEALNALRFANSDPAVALAAGTVLEGSNWGEDAVDAYAQALSLDQSLADSPFWTGSPFRRVRFPDIVGRSALAYSPCALLRLTTEQVPKGSLSREEALAACRQRVAANPGDVGGRTALAEALIQEGNLSEAFLYLDQALARQPDNGRARTALGRWYDARGDRAEARSQWLRAGQLSQVEALVLLGDSYLPGEVPSEVVQALRSEIDEAASEVQVHRTGILYYRRSFYRGSPSTILLPGEWQQAVPGRYARAQEALTRWTVASD